MKPLIYKSIGGKRKLFIKYYKLRSSFKENIVFVQNSYSISIFNVLLGIYV